MKISAMCIAAAAMLSIGTAALAADGAAEDIYNKTDYSVSDPNAAEYKTVLIADPNDVPVYIDQASGSCFGETAEFFLKESPDRGTYTVRYGTEDGYIESKTFIVGVDPANAETKMDPIQEGGINKNEDGTLNVGFTASVSAEIQYRSVILKQGSNGMCMGYDIAFDSIISGEGNVLVGIQINNIPKEIYDGGIEVYLSTKSVEEYGTADTVDDTGGMTNEEIL